MCIATDCETCPRKVCEGINTNVCDTCQDIKEDPTIICKHCGQRYCENCGSHNVCYVCRKFSKLNKAK